MQEHATLPPDIMGKRLSIDMEMHLETIKRIGGVAIIQAKVIIQLIVVNGEM